MTTFGAMRSRVISFVSVSLALCVASCGGSAATLGPAAASTKSSWQVILTVKTSYTCFDPLAGCGFGIAGIALDGKGDLYLTELDDDLIYEYTTAGELVRQWGGTGSGPGEFTSPEKLPVGESLLSGIWAGTLVSRSIVQ